MSAKTERKFAITVFLRGGKITFDDLLARIIHDPDHSQEQEIDSFFSDLAKNCEYWLCLTAIENPMRSRGLFPRERHINMSRLSMKR